jgi:hypothetical protein
MSLAFQSLFDDSSTVATADFKYSWRLPIALVANQVFGSLNDDRSIGNTRTSTKQDNQRSGRLNQVKAENKKRRPRSGERKTTKTGISEHPLQTAIIDMLEFGSNICGSAGVVKREYRHGKDTPNVSKSHNADKNIPRPRNSRKKSYDSLFDFSKTRCGQELDSEYLPSFLRQDMNFNVSDNENATTSKLPQARLHDDIFTFSDLDDQDIFTFSDFDDQEEEWKADDVPSSSQEESKDDFAASFASLEFHIMEEFTLTPTSFYGTKIQKSFDYAESFISFPTTEESKEDVFAGLD